MSWNKDLDGREDFQFSLSEVRIFFVLHFQTEIEQYGTIREGPVYVVYPLCVQDLALPGAQYAFVRWSG